jgi:hypothetical protein
MDRSCASARSGKVLVSVQKIHQGNGASQDDVHEDEQGVAEDLPYIQCSHLAVKPETTYKKLKFVVPKDK